MVLDENLCESALYVVSSDYIDAYAHEIRRVTMENGLYEGNVTSKPYVDDMVLSEKEERLSSESILSSGISTLSSQCNSINTSIDDIYNELDMTLKKSQVANIESLELSSNFLDLIGKVNEIITALKS